MKLEIIWNESGESRNNNLVSNYIKVIMRNIKQQLHFVSSSNFMCQKLSFKIRKIYLRNAEYLKVKTVNP